MSLISLGNATAYALLAYTTISSTGNSIIYGDMGIYPGSSYTGFPPATCSGDIYAATADAGFAQADALLAYNDAAGQASGVTMSTVDLGGQSLSPDVYTWASDAGLSSGDLYLDAGGDIDAVWIFQVGTSLNIASGSSIFFTSGLGNPENVFWQVGSSATINSGCAFIGNILAYTSISLATGATAEGHLVGLTGAITLEANTVSITGSLTSSPTVTPSPTSTYAPSLMPTSSSQKSSSNDDDASIGIIIGCVAGGLLLLALVAFGIWYYRKQQAAKA